MIKPRLLIAESKLARRESARLRRKWNINAWYFCMVKLSEELHSLITDVA
jgi:hypothetical protein